MNIGYIVEETNRAGSLRSRLFTHCPWHALAEWLVKTYRPMGFPPGARPGDGEMVLEVRGDSMVIDYAFLSVSAAFHWRDEPVRSIKISTEILEHRIEPHYSSGSAKIYLDDDYNRAILKMKERMVRYCSDEMDVAYVLSQFAANDPLHPFWRPRLFNRVRGLNF
jgi:hypothetical protein